jgi:hypothetical protein
MSNPTTATARRPTYTVWLVGREERGSAKDILQTIQRNANPDSQVHKLSLDTYVATLIDGASHFFPDGIVPEILATRDYPTKYDQALEYLSVMPASGVRILSRRE